MSDTMTEVYISHTGDGVSVYSHMVTFPAAIERVADYYAASGLAVTAGEFNVKPVYDPYEPMIVMASDTIGVSVTLVDVRPPLLGPEALAPVRECLECDGAGELESGYYGMTRCASCDGAGRM